MPTPAFVVHGTHPTVRFAARELARHLRLATGRPARRGRAGPPAAAGPAIRVGLAAELGVRPPAGLAPDADWICLRSRGSDLLLCGANPRSVLFAVYRYLRGSDEKQIGSEAAVV
jgi:hypothetical protein